MEYSRVREVFDYDEESGFLTWKNHMSRKCRKGSKANHLSPSGYIKVHVDGKSHRAHRLIWLWNYGYLPENDIDHINGDRSDNRLENLREVTRSCNLYNKIKRSRGNTGITGVYEYEGSYDAKIFKLGKSIHLGRFKDLTEAVAHRLAAEQSLGIDFYLSTPAKVYIDTYILLNKESN
jgi:hypothetical protein